MDHVGGLAAHIRRLNTAPSAAIHRVIVDPMDGAMDVSRGDVYLRVRRVVMVEGMSIREAARTFGLHRDTVRKMLAYSVPPGYRRQTPAHQAGQNQELLRLGSLWQCSQRLASDAAA